MSNFEPSATCLKLAESFSAVVDGEAPQAVVDAAMEHMAQCTYCEKEFSEFKALVERCRQSSQPIPEPECRQKLVALFKQYQQGETL